MNDLAETRVDVALTLLASRVGGLLNTIRDDDEREQHQQHFERQLNYVLYAGSVERSGSGTLFDVAAAAARREWFV